MRLVIKLFRIKEETKTVKAILISCCILLFSMILISIFYYGNSTLLGNLYAPDNDDVKFIRSAWILAQTGDYVYHKPPSPTVFMMPGLSYTLAFLMKIFGEFGGITAFRIVQASVQVLSLLLVFFIARKIFNSKAAILAVILDTIYMPEIWVPNLILTETLFKFFVLCLVYFSICALDEGRTSLYILGGVFLGIAALFRPTIATYPVLILAMWIIKKVKFRDAAKYTAIVMITFCLVLSPWWIRNYTIFHRFIPLTMATGNPMLQGTFINYDQSTKATDGLDYSIYDTKSSTLTELQKNDLEIALSKYRLQNLFPKQPLDFIYWYTVGKAKIQVGTSFYWKELFGVPPMKVKYYHLALLYLAIFGAVVFFMDKSKKNIGYLPLMLIVYFVVVYLPFFTMSRYFYPAMPYVIMFASYFCVKTFEFLRQKMLRPRV
jgi:4-amino-4-deoxy-L-arabinose transferase-like glycosyltransferase